MSIVQPYKNVFNRTAAFPGNITIDLASRYAAAFGAKAVGSLAETLFLQEKEANKFEFQYYPKVNQDYAYLKLSLPQLEPLEFSAMLTGEIGNVFAPVPLITFSQQKSFVETKVNDDDNIVIERWGTMPWVITVQALLIDIENRIYPTEQVRRLTRFFQSNSVVDVVGLLFEEKGIDSVYFKSYEVRPIEGFSDTLEVNLTLSSIKSVNFTLLKPNI
ncbi:MAG: DUF6046 domain-containing protein [Flavobacteriaceae bacterium]|nr:DUF6046 domain-containing protein [Flavobacteriaceae bacterium]